MCLKTRIKGDVLIEIIQLNRRELEIRPWRSVTQRICYVHTLPRGQTSNPYLFQRLTSPISKREISTDQEKLTPLNNFPLSKLLIHHREHIIPLSPTSSHVGLPTCSASLIHPADFLSVVAWKNITLYIYLSSHPHLSKSYFCEHFFRNYDQLMHTWLFFLLKTRESGQSWSYWTNASK